MVVLSLFDGMSCGQIALQKLGFHIDTYYASEVDKYAIEITKKNFPQTIHIGDVTKVSYSNGILYTESGEYNIPHIDLLIGGSPCFVAGTKIISNNSIENIENIKIGDLVLTHKNQYEKVLNVGSDIKDTYELMSQSSTGTITTSNHPYHIRKRYYKWNTELKKTETKFTEPKWVEVKDINKGDYVSTPILNTSENPYKLTEDEAYLIGVYIGDGHTRKDFRKEKGREKDRMWSMIISVGAHEKAQFENNINNIKYSIYPHSRNKTTDKINVYRACFYNKRLVEYVEKNCGTKANKKHFSKDILDLPNNLLKKVIEGYLFADGYQQKDVFRASSTSKLLAETLTIAIAKVYRTTTNIHHIKREKTCIIEGRTVNQNEQWEIKFKKQHPKKSRAYVFDDYILNPVKHVKKTGDIEHVFNLEVENDNTYIANNHIVHNCTGFSKAGRGLNFDDPQSKLFFDYIRIKNEINPTHFLLENVVMKQEYVDIITEYTGVEPLPINSGLVSAQNRPRIYWTDIPNVIPPEDKNIHIEDVIDLNNRTHKKNNTRLIGSYFSELGMKEFHTDNVCFTTVSRYQKKVKLRDETIVIRNHKHGTLTTSNSYLVKMNELNYDPTKPFENCILRKVTVNEAEELQTVPKDYTEGFSNTQRYKVLGNGWTVDVIAHIFSFIHPFFISKINDGVIDEFWD